MTAADVRKTSVWGDIMAMHDGHRARMKRRYLETNLSGFDDLAVLEFILYFAIPRRDTNPIAHALLDRYGNLSNVLEANYEDLRKIDGVGDNAAMLLTLFLDVARAHMMQRTEFNKILNSTTRVGDYLAPRFFGERNEAVWLLCMDAKRMVLDCRELFRGGVNSAGVKVRKIVEIALSCNATFLVLAHNHTSGIALPSHEDDRTTERLFQALDAVGIELIDHIIVANNDYISMAESGFFDHLVSVNERMR